MDEAIVDSFEALVPFFAPVNIETGGIEFALSFPDNLNRWRADQLTSHDADSEQDPNAA
jgi:hypothetical protein